MAEITPSTELKPLDDTISQEYNIWSKNVQYLYDELITTVTKWPSQTIEFFDYATYDEQKGITTQNLLTTTQTSGSEQEFLFIKRLDVPDLSTEERLREYKEVGENFEFGINTQGRSKKHCEGGIKDEITIPIGMEVNRARICPQASNLIACRGDAADILLYDYTWHKNHKMSDHERKLPQSETEADFTLKGHKEGGFGLSWSILQRGLLCSSGNDGSVCVFDLESSKLQGEEIKKRETRSPSLTISHGASVAEVCFSKTDPNMLAHVGDDKHLNIVDLRQYRSENAKNGSLSVKVSETELYCVDFPTTSSNKIAVGTMDGIVKIFDIRRLENDYPLKILTQHTAAITSVKFNPVDDNLLLSSSDDRRVCVWDCKRSLETHDCQKEKCTCFDEAIPELIFVHGGHTDNVNDAAWNPVETSEIASSGHDCQINFWKASCF